MKDEDNHIPEKLREIVELFAESEGREKVELLIDYAQRMPEMPEEIRNQPGVCEPVEECMTPVSVFAALEDGGMQFTFDVPPESPTVRGLAAIMAEGLSGASPEAVLGVPKDFYEPMGLEQVLTMQRLNGFTAILAHMKRLATQALGAKT
jgi:cysteine desulfuration protein SufE